jgi:predicted CoA-binding protein
VLGNSAESFVSKIDHRAIEDFLGCRRIAFAGVSRKPGDFSRGLFRALLRHGYELIPVHPLAREVDGIPCAPRVGEIQPAPEAALLMCWRYRTDQLVRECAAAGIPRIWLYRGAGKGAVTDSAVAFCRERGIQVVAGECPYMFLPGAGLPHRIHGWFRGFFGLRRSA